MIKRNKLFPDKAPKPVDQIELPEQKGIKKRIIIAVVLLVIGLTFIGVSVFRWLSYDPGWTRVEPTSISSESVASEMILLYELGVSETSPTSEYKSLSILYTDLCSKAYHIFHADYGFDGVHNPYYINRNIGQEIEVDSALYRAFEQIQEANSRFLFAAPFYTEYINMFSSKDDFSAKEFDPYNDEQVAEYFTKLSAFTSSEEHVSIELLGNNKVKLNVSPEFQAFAQENAIDTFIDFFWAKNAFIVDYIADSLIESGYVYGTISAYDGFMRSFDVREDTSYSYNLIAKYAGNVYDVGRYDYSGKNSLVFLRSFKTNDLDMTYYCYADGTERHAYVDANDGLCKNSLDTLVSYSNDSSCAKVLLSVMPIYVSNEFKQEDLISLAENDIYSIWFDGTLVRHNENAAVFKKLYDDGVTKFTAEFTK